MTESDRIREYFRSTSWRVSAGREYLARERWALLRSVTAYLGASPEHLAVCDVGCGAGADLTAWAAMGVPENCLAGTELLEERAVVAREHLPKADIRTVDGFDLPFDSAAFDVCSASLVLSTVMSSGDRERLLMEMFRVTRPGGVIAVYDFRIRKPWNRSVAAVTTRELTALYRAPDVVRHAGPFLPALDLALHLPDTLQRAVTGRLPRTHRLWAWRR